NGANLAETDLRHHPLKTGALDAACSGTAKIIIDHLDLGPAKCSQAIAHGVLQRAALPVVQNLMSRRLESEPGRHAADGRRVLCEQVDLLRHAVACRPLSSGVAWVSPRFWSPGRGDTLESAASDAVKRLFRTSRKSAPSITSADKSVWGSTARRTLAQADR